MSREPCEECGQYFDPDDMIPSSVDDDGGEMVQLYICDSCAEWSTLDLDIPTIEEHDEA